MSEWIKCSERLPEFKKDKKVTCVLFCMQPFDSIFMHFGHYSDLSNKFYDEMGGSHGICDILYWMELPEFPPPPEGD